MVAFCVADPFINHVEFDPHFRRLSVSAPVKINLCLHVFGKRRDGFHELQSLACFADFGDHLTLELNEPTNLTISGPFSTGLPVQENLILSVARLYADSVSDGLAGGHFRLFKCVPIASGIGGGSADAAAALRLLGAANNGYGLEETRVRVPGLGFDISACLESRSCWMRGYGTHLEFVHLPSPLYAVLVNPGIAVSTATVFGALNAQEAVSSASCQLAERWSCVKDLLSFLKMTRNDLEAVALRLFPSVGRCLEAVGATRGCLLARMSGSGGTVFGLYETKEETRRASSVLQSVCPSWWVRPVQLGDFPSFPKYQ
ncbi:MAG: 4-(cytidine 5'-diphospho)-2-C-methyl-D-erythritol kinase [Alphaproteobacteria bacterium]|nr:4-(cytidine 5'-diphospho)-2-C-methyl-D-erythritol kinase [Alphaproteobacteria bacterium]